MSVLKFIFKISFELFSAKVGVCWPEVTVYIFALHNLRTHYLGIWIQVCRIHGRAKGEIHGENVLILDIERFIPWLSLLLRLQSSGKRTILL